MFQLFKKRNFSDYISDTFSFFRITGKHFFKNYFIINGTLLILLMVLTYFVFKVYFEMMFANIGSSAPNFLEDYFNNNIGLIIGVFLLFFLWATKNGQFDDDYTPSVRMLFEDEPKLKDE